MKRFLVSILAFIIILNGCTSSTKKQEVIVLAAASLTEVFSEIEGRFEKINPDIDIIISFSGSQSCATAIKEGVHADIFASANEKYMDELVELEYIDKSDKQAFANNKLILITYKDNKKIQSLEDLILPRTKIIVADESVPVGKYTEKMIDEIDRTKIYGEDFADKFNNNIISKENDVKSVAAKIELNEGDAGIVYYTDYTKANKDKVNKIEIENKENPITTYYIAKLKNSGSEKAIKFVDYILSEEGKEIMSKYGFIVDSK